MLTVMISVYLKTSLKDVIFSGGTVFDGHIEFYITFSLSAFSASLGLSNCLKNGVARIIGDGGFLDGLLSARYLLAFFACALCLLARGACLGIVTDPCSEVKNRGTFNTFYIYMLTCLHFNIL